MPRVNATIAMGGLWAALVASQAVAQQIPEPPPPTPPGRSAHAVLRGAEPRAEYGHGVFREVGTIVKLVLNATAVLPGEKTVSLVAGTTCDMLEEVDDDGRKIGRLEIDDGGRGRMTAKLGGVSTDPAAPNTIIGALLVVHTEKIEACGEILQGQLQTPLREGEQVGRSRGGWR